jgi:hypothetical protein
MVTSPPGLGPENDCAGEEQQQLQTADPFSRRGERCYVRTNKARVQLGKKSLFVCLNGLDAKTN